MLSTHRKFFSGSCAHSSTGDRAACPNIPRSVRMAERQKYKRVLSRSGSPPSPPTGPWTSLRPSNVLPYLRGATRAKVTFPCRFQILRKGPTTPHPSSVIVDVQAVGDDVRRGSRFMPCARVRGWSTLYLYIPTHLLEVNQIPCSRYRHNSARRISKAQLKWCRSSGCCWYHSKYRSKAAAKEQNEAIKICGGSEECQIGASSESTANLRVKLGVQEVVMRIGDAEGGSQKSLRCWSLAGVTVSQVSISSLRTLVRN